jgi:hypothetical protein
VVVASVARIQLDALRSPEPVGVGWSKGVGAIVQVMGVLS